MKAQLQKETEDPKDQPGKPPQRSPITTGTIELVLQFLPADVSPDGRRIRHMLSLNGKVLALGTHRAGELPALLASLGTLPPEGILARLEEYVTQCQQRVGELQRQREKKPATPAKPAPRSRPAASSPLPPQPQAADSTRPTTQGESAEVPQQLSLF